MDSLMRITRSLTIPALALALLATGGTASAIASGVGAPTPPAPVVTVPNQCEEDEPCWDCTLMGNRICGLPDVPANKEARTLAWEAWDKAEGWRYLRVDPSREFRVDVVGYATEPPAGRFSLKAEDSLWYVFATS